MDNIIFEKIKNNSKILKGRYDNLHRYISWIILNDRSNVKDEILIPFKPDNYKKIHEFCVAQKYFIYKNNIQIMNKTYCNYILDGEKLKKYIDKLKKRIISHNKLITKLKKNETIKSRTDVHRLYNNYKYNYELKEKKNEHKE